MVVRGPLGKMSGRAVGSLLILFIFIPLGECTSLIGDSIDSLGSTTELAMLLDEKEGSDEETDI